MQSYLGAVDELGQRDVCVVAKDVDVLPVASGSVLEAESEEVTDIGGRATAELDSQSRAVVGWRNPEVRSLVYSEALKGAYGFQRGRVLLRDTGLSEE